VSAAVGLGTGDGGVIEYARDQDRVILSEDTDFRGADETLDPSDHPGVLACDTEAKPGASAVAVAGSMS
jgi:predicted nuclease of predicted toxin-antitoxin system